MVRDYPVKKGIKMDNDYIKSILQEFAGGIKEEGGHIISNFPGLKRIELWTDGKKLFAITETDTSYEKPQETIKNYNALIEKLTGYTAKERKKLLSK
ncbi:MULTISPECIES: DUF5611 family protein [Acidiplasma]|jgi:hypothetical protein|uniref:DUF5611 domain-containing protein n=2 Tax=Acidiplasma TaxID=507753 RepID=A0A0Q0XJL3_9ARCH|nr:MULTISPECIES: DUF5611 family protein [Acidiplasma]KJE49480.1 hypothetical protein TZ01_05545 [Acidiplasma sp. MBA-1]KPV46344.1 hypothetical protein SE19_05910 [Acidiplasma aeolicum]KQB35126.1 hypothetical protein AOG55_07725 [Acidiplasma cupricumulans]KQB36705.1 hypothetical protein AOG54_00020 [Acidiplasma aeolicum]WMT54538.1 MAG: DUF5611 family protein [Acidiplasma sp.]